MNSLRLLVVVIFSLWLVNTVGVVGVGQLAKGAEMVASLYSAIRGQSGQDCSEDITPLLISAGSGAGPDLRINGQVGSALENSDQAFLKRLGVTMRRQEIREVKRTIHLWGAILLASQLAIGGLVIYIGKRVIDDLEGASL